MRDLKHNRALTLDERINAKSYGSPLHEYRNQGSKDDRKSWVDKGIYPNDKELKNMSREDAEKWYGKTALSRPAGKGMTKKQNRRYEIWNHAKGGDKYGHD